MSYFFVREKTASSLIQEGSFSILDRVVVNERASVRSGYTVGFYTVAGEPRKITVEMSTAKVMLFLRHLKGKANVEVCGSLKSLLL
jgi:hypothetical protein